MLPAAAQEDGERGYDESQVVSAALFSSLSAPDSACSPSHKRQSSTILSMVFCMDYSSSGTATASVPSMGCNPSGTDCSSMGSPQVPPQEPATAQIPHSTDAQIHQEPALAWVLLRVTTSFKHIPLFCHGDLLELQMDLSPSWTSMCCRSTAFSPLVAPLAAGKSLLHHLEHLLPLLP